MNVGGGTRFQLDFTGGLFPTIGWVEVLVSLDRLQWRRAPRAVVHIDDNTIDKWGLDTGTIDSRSSLFVARSHSSLHAKRYDDAIVYRTVQNGYIFTRYQRVNCVPTWFKHTRLTGFVSGWKRMSYVSLGGECDMEI